MKKYALLTILLLSLVFANVFATGQQENSVDSIPMENGEISFKGEVIEIYIPFKEGGGTDTYARFMAPYFTKYLPGNPSVVVFNFPGGGGITGANKFDSQAENDGTTLLGMSASVIMNRALGNELARFKLDEYIPVIMTPSLDATWARYEATEGAEYAEGVKKLRSLDSFQAAFKSPGSSAVYVTWQMENLGLNINPINGLSGSDAKQAFVRGELLIKKGSESELLGLVEPMRQEKEAVLLYVDGILNENGDIVGNPSFPDLPTYPEVYREVYGKEMPADLMEIYMLGVYISMAGKSLLLPEDTPQAIQDVWTEAVGKMLNDPEFLEESRRISGSQKPFTGPLAAEALQRSAVLPQPTKDAFNEIYEEMGLNFRAK